MNALVFGASLGGRKFYDHIENKKLDILIMAFIDNDIEKLGTEIHGIPVISPSEIEKFSYDKIFIAVGVHSFVIKIIDQLCALGVDKEKIETVDYIINGYDEESDYRVNWLKDYAQYACQKNLPGSVAECGVFKGHFAKYINKFFRGKKLYLFDTFEGFREQDLSIELGMENESFNNSVFAKEIGIFGDVNLDFVMDIMPYPDDCIIKKGYFPQSAVDVCDQFCFVNLDMDLYQPMLAGLEFFWNKMVSGGVLLLHDYFQPSLPGVAQAVADFESKSGRQHTKIPIGDFCSIALIKGDS